MNVIDLFVVLTAHLERKAQIYRKKLQLSAAEARADLNVRLKQYSLGYEALQIGNGAQLIKKDNEQIHKDVVLPALRLLYDEQFKGADDEYRSAHHHYLEGEYRDCISDCGSAFESTMKTICNRRGWSYQPNDAAKRLIEICLENGLFPSFMKSHLDSIRASLTDGAPVVRNKLGSHGQGEEVKNVPQHISPNTCCMKRR